MLFRFYFNTQKYAEHGDFIHNLIEMMCFYKTELFFRRFRCL